VSVEQRSGGAAALVPWTRHVGAWLAIGSSPGALVLGAQLADERSGPLPLVWLLPAVALMASLLLLHGRLGLRPPIGHGQTFAELSRGYLSAPARTAVGLLVAAGMVGWVGFSVGIGGESLARVVGVPRSVCVLGLGGIVLALALSDARYWNRVAVGTTVLTLLAAPLLLLGVDRVESPVTPALGSSADALVLVAAFVGYVAVFMLRSPDFTAGLARGADLLACVAGLVLPALGLVLVGAALHVSGDGGGDATLGAVAAMRWGGMPVGDLLVVCAVLAPAVAAAYSGGLALQTFTGARRRVATSVIATLGLVLGVLGFHRVLVDWLALLAGIGPPIAVPFWYEAARRRRGLPARLIPTGVWLPPAIAGGVLMGTGVPAAPLLALAAALVVAGVWGLAGRRTAPAAAGQGGPADPGNDQGL
jgi:cytosine permease